MCVCMLGLTCLGEMGAENRARGVVNLARHALYATTSSKTTIENFVSLKSSLFVLLS